MSSCAVLKIPDVYGELTFSHPEGLWTGDGRGAARPATLENSKVLYGNFSGSTSTMTNAVPARKVHLSLVPNKQENPDSTKVLPLFSKGLYRAFSGKELDTETGLYYFGARYYDPRISLWESADPAFDKYLPGAEFDSTIRYQGLPQWTCGLNLPGRGGIYNSSNLGLYSFTQNNPLRLVDPDGSIAGEDDLFVAGAGAVIGIGGQAVEDLAHGKLSSWQAYLGSAVGGAVGTDLAYNAILLSGGTLTGPALFAAKEASNATGGFISDSLSSVTEDLSTGNHHVDWGKAGTKGLWGAGFGLIPGGDFTSSAAKGIMTKLGTKQIEGLSLKSAEKIGLGKGLESIIPTTLESLKKGFEERYEDHEKEGLKK